MKIMIEDDPNRFIEFDPADPTFKKKFLEMNRKFIQKKFDMQTRLKKKPKSSEADQAASHEMAAFMREQIDTLFGPGASNKIFGNIYSLAMINEFIGKLVPFIREGRK
jgi:hypothetical protein